MPFRIELISLSLRVRYISPGKQCCQGPALEGNGFKHLVQFQHLEIVHLDEEMKSDDLFLCFFEGNETFLYIRQWACNPK